MRTVRQSQAQISEAEVSLRLAFFLLDRNLTRSDVSVAIDGAQIKTGKEIHFDIRGFLARNGYQQEGKDSRWQGRYRKPGDCFSVVVHCLPGKGDVVATLYNGRILRAESKKGPLAGSKSSPEYPLMREAIGQLMTLEEIGESDFLVVAVPESAKYRKLIDRWGRAPLIERLRIQFITVDARGLVRGLNIEMPPNSPKGEQGLDVPQTQDRECFDAIVREFIDFVNMQVGAYMDALAGYAGHCTRVERQVHRVMRPSKVTTDEAGNKVVVCASYEDPTKPEIVLNRIVRAGDYLAANAKGGTNEQQHARAILIFIFTYWELEIRPRLAACIGAKPEEIRSDIMGDLRILRNVVLHSKGVFRADRHKELKRLGGLFAVDKPLHIGYEDLHQILVLVKQDCARMLLEWTGAAATAPFSVNEVRDVAIQRTVRTDD